MADEHADQVQRREFLRRAGIAGAAAVWAAPIVNTIAATPAYAQAVGTPQPCFKSTLNAAGWSCMDACAASGCTGDACDGVDADPNQIYCNQGPCQFFCPSGQGGDNPCCNPGLCDPANFFCDKVTDQKKGWIAIYNGPTVGCPDPNNCP